MDEFQSPGKLDIPKRETLVLPEKIERGPELARGGNTIAYEVVGHPDLILRQLGGAWGGAPINLEERSNRQHRVMETLEAVPPTVQAARILRVWIEDGHIYELMDRAPGAVLHERNGNFDQWKTELQQLAAAPLEQYIKLIQDVHTLHDHHFAIDPSKPDNIFYDPEIGFTMIDLNPESEYLGSLEVPLIHTYFLFTKYRDQLDGEIKEVVETILAKLEAAGDIIGPGTEYMKTSIHRVLGESRT